MFLKASDVVRSIQEYIDRYGDLPVEVKVVFQPISKKGKAGRMQTIACPVTSIAWGANDNNPGKITITTSK